MRSQVLAWAFGLSSIISGVSAKFGDAEIDGFDFSLVEKFSRSGNLHARQVQISRPTVCSCARWCGRNELGADCLQDAKQGTGQCFECGPGSNEPDNALCDGLCVNTQTSRANCGACNNQCGLGEMCVSGECMGDDLTQFAVRVSRLDNNDVLGFLSNSEEKAPFVVTKSVSEALAVGVKVPTGETVLEDVELTMLNLIGLGGFTKLGFVQGRDNTDSTISLGSSNYLYVMASGSTPAGSPPSSTAGNSYSILSTPRTSESSVWNVSLVNGRLTGTWTNPNGGTPMLSFLLQEGIVYATGDADQFALAFPAGQIRVQLTLIPFPVAIP